MDVTSALPKMQQYFRKMKRHGMSEDRSLWHTQKVGKYHARGMGIAPAKDHFAMPSVLLHH